MVVLEVPRGPRGRSPRAATWGGMTHKGPLGSRGRSTVGG
jgi:hypothetical protein